MHFKQWFIESAHQDDEAESLIADTVYNILDKAIRMFFKKNKETRLSDIIKQIVGRQADDSRGRLEITIPNKIKGRQLPDHFFQHGPLKIIIEPVEGDPSQIKANYGYGHLKVNIHTPTLSQAQSYDDPSVQNMMMKLQYQLHHEASHISSAQVGDNAKDSHNPYLSKQSPQGSQEYNQGKIDYYTDPGELRAHAKQFAVMYERFYPDQPFDIQKMMALDGHTGGKIKRFFQGLNDGDSSTWNMDTTPYRQQMSQAGATLMQNVNHFLQLIRKNR
jgi:hypothetical protein